MERMSHALRQKRLQFSLMEINKCNLKLWDAILLFLVGQNQLKWLKSWVAIPDVDKDGD